MQQSDKVRVEVAGEPGQESGESRIASALGLARGLVHKVKRKLSTSSRRGDEGYRPRFIAFVRASATEKHRCGWDGNLGLSRLIPLTSEGYSFSFTPPAGDVEEIQLVLGRMSGEVNGSLECAVYVDDVIRYRTSILASEIDSDLYHSVWLRPSISSSGRERFTVSVVPTAESGDCGIGYRDSPPILQENDEGIDTMLPVVTGADTSKFPDEARFVPIYLCIDQPTGRIHEKRVGWEGIGRERVAVTLDRGTRIGWNFRYPFENLNAVDLLIGTYGRQNECTLTLLVRCGKDEWRVTRDGRDALNNAYLRFQLDGCSITKGDEVHFVLQCDDATPRSIVSIWGAIQDPPQEDPSLVRAYGPHREFHLEVAQPIDTESEGPQVGELPITPLPYDPKGRDSSLCVFGGSEAPTGVVSQLSISRPIVVHASSIHYHLDLLDGVKEVLLWRVTGTSHIRELVRIARSRSIPVICLYEPPKESGALALQVDRKRIEDNERAIQSLLQEVEGLLLDEDAVRNLPVVRQRILDRSIATRLPRVSVISVLFGRPREVVGFISSFVRQTYEGEIELVLVEDQSPDDVASRAAQTFEQVYRPGGFSRSLSVVRNSRNMGNCVSRNRGIHESSGEILIIIDADCVVNSTFVERHVRAHRRGDVDVVIGPMNIESPHLDPDAHMAILERSADEVRVQSQLQDPTSLPSFLNCVTRNISFRREFLLRVSRDGREVFNPEFSYSKDPESGYGWEDVELGVRLYKAGARIGYEEKAISIHQWHETSHEKPSMPPRSLKNFRRLLDAHPELLKLSRRWVHETFRKIVEWYDAVNGSPNSDREAIEAQLRTVRQFHSRRFSPRPLRVLTYRWHAPHQFELYKTGHEFYLVTDSGAGIAQRWPYDQRPLPGNAHLVSKSEIDPGTFDLALLHFDENVLDWELTNGVIGPDWGASFRWLSELPLPKIAVCHGTPQFIGQYAPTFRGPDPGAVIESARVRLVHHLSDVHVVCNSFQAEREWQFQRSSVIWQGFDPAEFHPATYEKGILSLGQSMKERPYYRGFHLYQQVMEGLAQDERPQGFMVPEPLTEYMEGTNEYAWAKYRNYVHAVRQYSIYFNPTLRSPMPRARGEAMMCGLVTVSANNHDVDMFIRNGWNGFVSNDPAELRAALKDLLRSKQLVRELGERSRQTAMDIFHNDAYLASWQKLFHSVLGSSVGERVRE